MGGSWLKGEMTKISYILDLSTLSGFPKENVLV